MQSHEIVRGRVRSYESHKGNHESWVMSRQRSSLWIMNESGRLMLSKCTYILRFFHILSTSQIISSKIQMPRTHDSWLMTHDSGFHYKKRKGSRTSPLPFAKFLQALPNYFFFLAAFLAVFFTAFFAAFFAVFAIAFINFVKQYEKL